MKPLESELQAQIVDYLRMEQARGRIGALWRVNGGQTRIGGDLIKFYRLWLPGGSEISKGMADVNGLLGHRSASPGRFFALEIKRPGQTTTAPQNAYLQAVREHGGLAAVVTNFNEAQAVLFGESQ